MGVRRHASGSRLFAQQERQPTEYLVNPTPSGQGPYESGSRLVCRGWPHEGMVILASW